MAAPYVTYSAPQYNGVTIVQSAAPASFILASQPWRNALPPVQYISGLLPLNALWDEEAIEGLGYSLSQAAQLLAPLIDKNAIIEMNQYFQKYPVQDFVSYDALLDEGYSPSEAANRVSNEQDRPIWQSALKNLVIPIEEAQQSFTNWFIIGIITAILITLLIILIL